MSRRTYILLFILSLSDTLSCMFSCRQCGCCSLCAGHVWDQRRGVSESALRAEQQRRGQRGQHDPDRRRGGPTAGQCQHAVGHPEGPAGHLTGRQGATWLCHHNVLSLLTPHSSTSHTFTALCRSTGSLIPSDFSCRCQFATSTE